jgi:Mrp family chromosome partitioning ATPase
LSEDICLVDANFGNGGLHDHFGVESQYGLADALVDKRSVSSSVQRVTNNLFLLSCGTPSADANESIHADAIHSCFADLRATFEYVLINIGPLTSTRDALALSQRVDGVVLVLEANGTSRLRARESKAIFERVGVKLLGAVLNNRDFPIPKAINSIIKLLINSHS